MAQKKSSWRSVDLTDVKADAGIQFIKADMAASPGVPFAIVRYTVDGNPPRFGLRLDLDKRVFLDHLDDKRRDEAVRSV